MSFTGTHYGLGILPGPWIEDAACRGMDPHLFFPTRGEAATEGLAICATCTVTEECLAYAIANGETWGTFGGMSAKQRRIILRKSRR
jgi:WhiB family transcriptional regulator, redox-sensing transcriptional regulator